MQNYRACKELTQTLNGYSTIDFKEPIWSLYRLSLYRLSTLSHSHEEPCKNQSMVVPDEMRFSTTKRQYAPVNQSDKSMLQKFE